jgi:hypothetical protein
MAAFVIAYFTTRHKLISRLYPLYLRSEKLRVERLGRGVRPVSACPHRTGRRLQLVPMKRKGMAEEVASLLLFLLSSEVATFMGAEVAINGCASL